MSLLTFLVPSPSISGLLDAGAQSMLGAMQTDRLKAFIWLSWALPWMQCSMAITCRSRSRFSLGRWCSNLTGRVGLTKRRKEGQKEGKDGRRWTPCELNENSNNKKNTLKHFNPWSLFSQCVWVVCWSQALQEFPHKHYHCFFHVFYFPKQKEFGLLLLDLNQCPLSLLLSISGHKHCVTQGKINKVL